MTTESVCDLPSSLIWASSSQFYNPYTWHPSMTLATSNWCLLLRCTQSTKWIWVLDWWKLGFHFARHSLTFCKQSVIEEDRSCKKALTKQNSQWPGFEPVPGRSVHRAVSGSGCMWQSYTAHMIYKAWHFVCWLMTVSRSHAVCSFRWD